MDLAGPRLCTADEIVGAIWRQVQLVESAEPRRADNDATRLIDHLRRRRSLLVLDHIENADVRERTRGHAAG